MVPARDLDHDGVVVGQGAVLHDRGAAVDARGAAVLAHVRGALDRPRPEDPGDPQDRAGRLLVELLVLGGEDVDRRGDDRDPARLEPGPDERRAGEHERVGGHHVGPQEVPRLADQVVRLVDADVRPPDDVGADCAQRRGEPGGLRIVEDHDVPWADQRRELRRGRVGDGLVLGPLGVCEGTAIPGAAVQSVVQALGDVEEQRPAVDDDPARVHAGPARIGQQRAQHLGHAAAVRGGVHAPDDASLQQLARVRSELDEVGELPRVQHVGEAVDRQRRDLDLLERAHAGWTAQAVRVATGRSITLPSRRYSTARVPEQRRQPCGAGSGAPAGRRSGSR